MCVCVWMLQDDLVHQHWIACWRRWKWERHETIDCVCLFCHCFVQICDAIVVVLYVFCCVIVFRGFLSRSFECFIVFSTQSHYAIHIHTIPFQPTYLSCFSPHCSVAFLSLHHVSIYSSVAGGGLLAMRACALLAAQNA